MFLSKAQQGLEINDQSDFVDGTAFLNSAQEVCLQIPMSFIMDFVAMNLYVVFYC